MRSERDAGQSRARLALAAGGEDHHFIARQAHCLVEADRVGEIEQIAIGPGDAQDAVERAAGDAQLAPAFDRHLTQGLQPRRVGRESGDEHAARGFLDRLAKPGVNPGFRARRRFLKDVGRIAHQSKNAAVADRAHHRITRRVAEHRRVVDFPVAGVENPAVRRFDHQAIALGDRVGERLEGDLEWIEVDAPVARDDVELDLAREPLFLELAGDQASGEWRGVKRNPQIGGEIGDRADVILMPVGQHDPDQILAALLDEFEFGQDQVDPGIIAVGKGQAKVDHQPFALGTVEIDVHANFPRAAKGQEKQFFAGCHSIWWPSRQGGRGPGW